MQADGLVYRLHGGAHRACFPEQESSRRTVVFDLNRPCFDTGRMVGRVSVLLGVTLDAKNS